ncbi:MAG: GGDEF domain-containing phosphodiesterase [Betaproteobacteria bacterium]|nr:GGDEF domain-containing phosphodiesterase [Betaproteobacteria bacterium]
MNDPLKAASVAPAESPDSAGLLAALPRLAPVPGLQADLPGFVCWSPGDAIARVSSRALDLLGIGGADSMQSRSRLWQGFEPADQASIEQACELVRPGGDPVALSLRCASASTGWVRVVIDALVHVTSLSWDVCVVVSTGLPPDQDGLAGARLVCYDGLTGEANRLQFQDQVGHALRRAARERALLAVMSIEVMLEEPLTPAQARGVEDFAGRLLRAASLRIGRALRAEDLAAVSLAPVHPADGERDTAGRFAVMLGSLAEPQDAIRVAVRIDELLSQPLVIDGCRVGARPRTGIALYPWDDQEAAGLLRCADAALERAGREPGSVRFFSKPINDLAADRLSLEGDLREAVSHEGFTLHYQPRLDAGTRRVVGLEALLRWRQPGQGLTRPGSFIDVAEQSRLIVPIGHWAIREACRQNRAWQRAGLPAVPVSVNVSMVQFRDEGFVAAVAALLAETGLAPELLELEIAEPALAVDIADVLRVMRALKALGVRLAIDGFGTGHTSLACLREYPIDAMTIDRSFIADIDRHPRGAATASALIDLAGRFGIAVTAVGVETERQRRLLLDHGCARMQGLLFARPGSAQVIEGLWRESLEGELPARAAPIVPVSGPSTMQ